MFCFLLHISCCMQIPSSSGERVCDKTALTIIPTLYLALSSQVHTQTPSTSNRRVCRYIMNIPILLQPPLVYLNCHTVYTERNLHLYYITFWLCVLIFEPPNCTALGRMLVINEINSLFPFVYKFIIYKSNPWFEPSLWLRESTWCVDSVQPVGGEPAPGFAIAGHVRYRQQQICNRTNIYHRQSKYCGIQIACKCQLNLVQSKTERLECFLLTSQTEEMTWKAASRWTESAFWPGSPTIVFLSVTVAYGSMIFVY